MLNAGVKTGVPDCFMVIDDDRTTIMLCKHTLRRFFAGVNTRLYMSPIEALKAIEEEYSQLETTTTTILFLDINMPQMSGWDFLEAFKNLSESVHKQFTVFIFSSSVDLRDQEKAASNSLVSGFILKPLTIENLNKIVM